MQLSHVEDRLADDFVTDLHLDGHQAHHARLSSLQLPLRTASNLARVDAPVELKQFVFRQPLFEQQPERWPIERRGRQRQVVR